MITLKERLAFIKKKRTAIKILTALFTNSRKKTFNFSYYDRLYVKFHGYGDFPAR